MEIEDLMIGDWVIHPYYKRPAKIVYFNGSRVRIEYEEVDSKSLRPIPLTPEILEKNGFSLKPDGWLWCKEKGIEDQNYIFIQFRKGCEEVRLVELNFVNNVQSKFERRRYVHELQHAMRMCNINKTIEL